MLNKDGVAVAVLVTNTAFGRIQSNLHHIAGSGGADESACRSHKRQSGMKHVIAGKVIFGIVFLGDAAVIKRGQRPSQGETGKRRGKSSDLGNKGIRSACLIGLKRGGADGGKVAGVSNADNKGVAQRVNRHIAPSSIVFCAASAEV